MRDVFEAWDEDGDGRVSRDEFLKAMPTLLKLWGLPKLAGAREVIAAVVDSFDVQKVGAIPLTLFHRRLLAVRPGADALQLQARNRNPLRSAAPRIEEAEELLQPMSAAQPVGCLLREDAPLSLPKLRSQARGFDTGIDAQFPPPRPLKLRQRLTTQIAGTYTAELGLCVGGAAAGANSGFFISSSGSFPPKSAPFGKTVGMSAAEFKLHQAKLGAWTKNDGALDRRVDPLSRFFHIDPALLAAAQVNRKAFH